MVAFGYHDIRERWRQLIAALKAIIAHTMFYVRKRLPLFPFFRAVRRFGFSRALGDIYYRKGLRKSYAGEYHAAIEWFDAALECYPHHANAYFGRGVAKTRRGDHPGALEDYSRVIELFPDVSSVYNNRGLVRTKTGDRHGALADFDKAIELDPANPSAYFNRGLVKSPGGADARALANIFQAARLGNPDAGEWLRDHGYEWYYDCN